MSTQVSTATVTSVAASATSVQLLASAYGTVQGRTVFNDSSALLYLKFGTTASTTSYTVQIPAGGYYEFPQTVLYAGRVDGIWASATGSARITEVSV